MGLFWAVLFYIALFLAVRNLTHDMWGEPTLSILIYLRPLKIPHQTRNMCRTANSSKPSSVTEYNLDFFLCLLLHLPGLFWLFRLFWLLHSLTLLRLLGMGVDLISLTSHPQKPRIDIEAGDANPFHQGA